MVYSVRTVDGTGIWKIKGEKMGQNQKMEKYSQKPKNILEKSLKML